MKRPVPLDARLKLGDHEPMTNARSSSRAQSAHSTRNVILGTGAAVLVLALAFTAHRLDRPITAAILALFGVTIAGAVLGVRGGVVAGIAASFGYNFLLTEPILTFTLPSSDDLVPILALNFSAIASGVIAGRLRDRAVAAERSTLLVAQLLAFSEALQQAVTLDQIEMVAEQHLGSIRSLQLFVDTGGSLTSASLSSGRSSLAEEVWNSRLPELRSADEVGFILASAERRIGVVVVEAHDPGAPAEIRSFLPLLALAVQRSLLAAELSEADAVRRSEAFKTALLSSVSHDLRTPLAAISAAASSLSKVGQELDRVTHDELLRTIQEQCDRLDRLTTNLLNIGRIEGGLDVKQMPLVDAVEVLGSALARMRKSHSDHHFIKDFEARSAIVRADEALLEQVYINVLDNAAVHTDAGTTVKLSARIIDGTLSVSIEDNGKGIAEKDRSRVFDRFFQGQSDSRQGRGSGLGLSIARGFTERIGGTICAMRASAPLTGARIRIELPLAKQ
jgi:two-component system sensor histidine kinase KdpD